jgi:hypothetical protein
MWHSLHSISFGYPGKVGNSPEDQKLKQDTFTFFEYLGSVLPCPECREHYKENFYKYDLMSSLDSRTNFTKWVYDLHNRVNKGTGVPESKWPTFEEVYKKYNSLRSENCEQLPGVCGSAVSDVHCKVLLVPKAEMEEGFENIEQLDTSWVIVIVLGFVILALLLYMYTCSGQCKNGTKKRGKTRKR